MSFFCCGVTECDLSRNTWIQIRDPLRILAIPLRIRGKCRTSPIRMLSIIIPKLWCIQSSDPQASKQVMDSCEEPVWVEQFSPPVDLATKVHHMSTVQVHLLCLNSALE
jgi:hypothetical protein